VTGTVRAPTGELLSLLDLDAALADPRLAPGGVRTSPRWASGATDGREAKGMTEERNG
jgi:hypothetical protein